MKKSDFSAIYDAYRGSQPVNENMVAPVAGQVNPITGQEEDVDDTPEITTALATLSQHFSKYTSDPRKLNSALQKLQKTFSTLQPKTSTAGYIPQPTLLGAKKI